MAAIPDSDGPLVVGRYELHEEIAAGGMAVVHMGRLAGPAGFSRPVAIKRLHPHLAKDPEFVAMFLDEARLAARIQHPNVVSTLDVVATRGELFLVMEYVQGESLGKLWRTACKSGVPIDPRVVGAVMSNALHGLHAAHEATDERGKTLGIVHRDVSPQNILVGVDGIARVLDFGVAKAVGRLQTTREGQVKGKLAYMAMEQLEGGEEITRKVDVYSSGVVCWEMLTGRRLYAGDTEAVVLARALRGNPLAVTSLNPALPTDIDAVVAKALAKNPSERYSSAREFALELEGILGVARPSEMVDWVRSMAGEVIDARSALILEMESKSSSASDTRDDPFVRSVLAGNRLPSTHPDSRAQVQVDETSVEPEQEPSSYIDFAANHGAEEGLQQAEPRKRIAILGAVLAVSAVVVTLVVLLLRPGTDHANVVVEPGSVASHVNETPTVAAPPPTDTAEPTASASTSASASVGTTSAPATPVVPTTKSRPPKQPRDCDPPYSLDAEGHKIWKKQCLR